MPKLSATEIKERLNRLVGWSLDDGIIKKEFRFNSFKQAMEFMNRLAPVAEKLNHHPDWFNSYNKVVISLTTHSAGGLSEADFKLARAADETAAGLGV